MRQALSPGPPLERYRPTGQVGPEHAVALAYLIGPQYSSPKMLLKLGGGDHQMSQELDLIFMKQRSSKQSEILKQTI